METFVLVVLFVVCFITIMHKRIREFITAAVVYLSEMEKESQYKSRFSENDFEAAILDLDALDNRLKILLILSLLSIIFNTFYGPVLSDTPNPSVLFFACSQAAIIVMTIQSFSDWGKVHNITEFFGITSQVQEMLDGGDDD